MRRLRIVISADWFPPAYRAGGPIRSAFNLCALLAKHHDVWVVTGAHDLGEAEALDVKRDAWNGMKVGDASVQVRYCSKGTLDRRTWGRILDEIKPQVLHLNSMFSKEHALIPLRLTRKRAGMRGGVGTAGHAGKRCLEHQTIEKTGVFECCADARPF